MSLIFQPLFDIRDGQQLAGAIITNRRGDKIAIGVPGKFAVMCRKRYERDPGMVNKVAGLMGVAVRMTKPCHYKRAFF